MGLGDFVSNKEDIERVLVIDDTNVDLDELVAEINDNQRSTPNVVSSQKGYIANDFDVEITEKDMDEALSFFQDCVNAGDLQLDEGETRSYMFDDKDGTGRKEIFVCDISAQAKEQAWAETYARGIGKGLSERIENLWANVVGNSLTQQQSMVIAGMAKDVGVAKEQFFAAMTMAGLKINDGKYEKVANSSDLFIVRLQEHGFDCKIAGSGNLELSFDALAEIPVEHRLDAVKVVLKNLVEDYRVMDKLHNNIIDEFTKRPGYERIQAVISGYDIKEEGLYHVLKRSISNKIIDPTGEITSLLEMKYDLTEQLLSQQEGYREASKTLFQTALQCGASVEDVKTLFSQDDLNILDKIGLREEFNSLAGHFLKQGGELPADVAQPAQPAMGSN